MFRHYKGKSEKLSSRTVARIATPNLTAHVSNNSARVVSVPASRVLDLASYSKLSGPEHFVEAATITVITISVGSDTILVVFGGEI